jgi:hypothetical protein
LSVYAIDGSYHTLPATQEIRKAFDPESGYDKKGKGHYPKCLITTAYDALRKFPIDLTVTSIHEDETEQATQKLIPSIPGGGVILFDRGYAGYQFLDSVAQYDGFFVLRNKATCTFKVVEDFVKSKKKEDLIEFRPNKRYLTKNSGKTFHSEKLLLRIIRLENKQGEVSVIITNLLDIQKYLRQEIIDLYFRRWEVETHYLDNKCTIEIETFHSKSVNGIKQEFFAAAIMTIITRIVMNCTKEIEGSNEAEPQFKNAIRKMANQAAILVATEPHKVYFYFLDILYEIKRVRYYKSKKKRPSQIRICKQAQSKWILNRMRIKCKI